MSETYLQEFVAEEEITILKFSEKGDVFFIHETSKFLTFPFQSCPKEPEPRFYKLPTSYPSIELTPSHLFIGLFVLICAFFIGKKTEKYRRTEEMKKKKMKKMQKKIYSSNEQYMAERAKYYFFTEYPNLAFKEEEDSRTRKLSDENLENVSVLENEQRKNFVENEEKNNEIILYDDGKVEDLKVKIFKEESKTLDKEIIEESYIVNWPLLDQKFSLSVDFTIIIENGLIKNISTKNKISKEVFQRLLLLMHEKFKYAEPNKKKKEILFLKNEEFEENSPLLLELDTLEIVLKGFFLNKLELDCDF